MKNLLKVKIIFSFVFLLFIIILHALLRFSEMPYSKIVLGSYFWEASVNLAAGKEFSEPSYLDKSPELSKFVNIPFDKIGEKLSLSNTFYEFTDYPEGPKKLIFRDSLGYRYIIGLIWKCFGFNWYFVGIFNYILSLTALLSLMYCSYRTLGVGYSFAIGLVFSISPTEINYIVSFGRDGIPLWFASYLICALIIFFNKSLTLKRITSYSLFIGCIIFASIQGRGSSTYFLPLLSIIYFILFFLLNKEKIKFKYSYLLTNSFFEKTFFFLFATSLTFFSEIFLQTTLNLFFLHGVGIDPYFAHTMHTIFLGLGVWGNKLICSSPLCYIDGHVHYLATDYGRRVLQYNSMPYLSSAYQDTLKDLYLLFIKTYPYSYFSMVVFRSFFDTLFFLGSPLNFVSTNSDIMKFIYTFSHITLTKPFLTLSPLLGSLILYFKLKQKKITVILGVFIFFNAGVSFLQHNARHALMGHPAYYFLTGIMLAYIFKCFLDILLNNFRFSSKRLQFVSRSAYGKSIEFLSRFSDFKFNTIPFLKIALTIFGSCFVICFSMYMLKSIENNNIIYAQKYFDSLEKHPIKFDKTQNTVILPSTLLFKTIGIYCEVGRVLSSNAMNIKINAAFFNYEKNINLTRGENVILFTPFYFADDQISLNIINLSQCQSLYWSDLKDWKGPLWEGSYDGSVVLLIKGSHE